MSTVFEGRKVVWGGGREKRKEKKKKKKKKRENLYRLYNLNFFLLLSCHAPLVVRTVPGITSWTRFNTPKQRESENGEGRGRGGGK